MKFYRGIVLVPPQGTDIVDGLKSTIVKTVHYHHICNVPLLLIQKKKGLGIIYLGEPIQYNLAEFKRRFREHRITPKEREKWWPTRTHFYSYPIIKAHFFKKPRPLDYPLGVQNFVRPQSITWLN